MTRTQAMIMIPCRDHHHDTGMIMIIQCHCPQAAAATGGLNTRAWLLGPTRRPRGSGAVSVTECWPNTARAQGSTLLVLCHSTDLEPLQWHCTHDCITTWTWINPAPAEAPPAMTTCLPWHTSQCMYEFMNYMNPCMKIHGSYEFICMNQHMNLCMKWLYESIDCTNSLWNNHMNS